MNPETARPSASMSDQKIAEGFALLGLSVKSRIAENTLAHQADDVDRGRLYWKKCTILKSVGITYSTSSQT